MRTYVDNGSAELVCCECDGCFVEQLSCAEQVRTSVELCIIVVYNCAVSGFKVLTTASTTSTTGTTGTTTHITTTHITTTLITTHRYYYRSMTIWSSS